MKMPPADQLDLYVDRSAGPDACWPWTGGLSKGYGKLTVGKVALAAHRVAYALTRGPVPSDVSVLHRCDNKKCCNPAHLFLGTQADNMIDMLLKGRERNGHQPGRRPAAKLTAADVVDIRGAHEDGEFTLEQLSDQYAISVTQVRRIVRLEAWSDI